MNPYTINTANMNKPESQVPQASSSVNSNMAKAKASVDQQHNLRLELTQSFANVPNPINAKLSLNQAALLNQQNVLVALNQNSLSVFLQSNISNVKVALSPQMAQVLSSFLKLNSNKPIDLKLLPKQIQDLFSQKLGLSPDQVLTRLMQIQLQQNAVNIAFLSGAPVAEISLGAAQQMTSESLQNLLQFLIPVPMQDQATILVKEKLNSDENAGGDGGLRFEVTFNLDRLGNLVVQVELNGFQLVTRCVCNNPNLEQLVNKHWPLLQERLNKLGFSTRNQIEFKPDVEKSNKVANSSNLINIKV